MRDRAVFLAETYKIPIHETNVRSAYMVPGDSGEDGARGHDGLGGGFRMAVCRRLSGKLAQEVFDSCDRQLQQGFIQPSAAIPGVEDERCGHHCLTQSSMR